MKNCNYGHQYEDERGRLRCSGTNGSLCPMETCKYEEKMKRERGRAIQILSDQRETRTQIFR